MIELMNERRSRDPRSHSGLSRTRFSSHISGRTTIPTISAPIHPYIRGVFACIPLQIVTNAQKRTFRP